MTISREHEIRSDFAVIGQFSFLKNGEVSSDKTITHAIDGRGKAEKIETWVKKKASEVPPIPEGLFSPEIGKQGMRVLEARYLKKEADGKMETPAEMFRRVAYNIGMADWLYGKNPEKTIEEFYEMMARLEFVPNSPTLMNAGRELQQLSACFVIPVEDDMFSIMKGATDSALVHKSGGGIGASFGSLRPEGDEVKTSSGVASGPLSFMEIYDTVTKVVKQGGRRRGANMAMMPVRHPDIKKFVAAKRTPGVLENFNISVALDDRFMEAVENNAFYKLVNPHNGKETPVKAREIFDLIAESAWESGEPGVVYIDEINKKNPTKHLGRIESTNPCGEQPLHPYESCNLGSINLSKMVEDGKIEWQRLRKTVRKAGHFLDNVIDVNEYPTEKIKETTLGNRRIGLGVMGFTDMLVKLGVSYDSPKAREIARRVMKTIQEEGYKVSQELAEERGVFPNWEGSDHQKAGVKMRNATVTTIAPTGSISIIAGCSSGIEPYFAIAYERKHVLGEESFAREVVPLFLEKLEEAGIGGEEKRKIIEMVEKNHGSVKDIELIPEELRHLFISAHDLSPEAHVRMQAIFQRYTDNAVSKTINFPNDASIEDVRKAYFLAYKLGCKGLTVYRDRSREKQVLEAKTERKEVNLRQIDEQTLVVENELEKPPVLDVLHSVKYAVKTGSGRLHATMSDELMKDEETGWYYWVPKECFLTIQPIGSGLNSEVQQSGLEKSYILQSEDPPYVKLIRNLKSVKGDSPIGFGETRVDSISHAVGIIWEYHFLRHGIVSYDESGNLVQLVRKKELKPIPQETLEGIQFASEGKSVNNEKLKIRIRGNIDEGVRYCSSCGTKLVYQEGCAHCPGCGNGTCT